MSVSRGPMPPGWDDGTTVTLAGAGSLFATPSSATVKLGQRNGSCSAEQGNGEGLFLDDFAADIRHKSLLFMKKISPVI